MKKSNVRLLMTFVSVVLFLTVITYALSLIIKETRILVNAETIC